MFSLTFLGHQGWLVSTPSTNLLIDPLLTPRFGHGGRLGRVYPPRVLDLAGFPPIDAVVLTHEHDDHFDIPSLVRLDRAIPIYLSSRSSHAAWELLTKLGFTVAPLAPDASLVLGDLRYRSFVSDHRRGDQGDEWDVFPMLVEDLDGHGQLWSSIDVATGPPALDQPACIWAHAHNATGVGFTSRAPASTPASADASLVLAAALRRLAAVEAAGGGPPAAALVVGQGWSFTDARAWLNHEAFPVAPAQVAEALALASPSTLARAPSPGFTLELVERQVVAVADQRPFIATLAPEGWPDRSFAPLVGPRPEVGPASGRIACSRAELDELRAGLDDFARYLYGGPVFRALASVADPVEGLGPALGFVLRVGDGDGAGEGDSDGAGGGEVTLRYDPRGCRFVRDDGAALVAGIEAWASDLLGFIRGELSPSALCYAGRLRSWSGPPGCPLRFPIHELWMYGHPLRRPEQAAALYRRLALEAEASFDGPRVPARDRASRASGRGR